MNRRAVALRVLCERKLARQFQEATRGMRAAQVGVHVQSIIAAALLNPSFVVEEITKGRAMALQCSTNRITHRPMLLTLPCADRTERETLRRLVLALTWLVAAQIDGPILPDSSSVVRALLGAWLNITVLNPAHNRSKGVGDQPAHESTKGKTARTPRTGKKARSEGVTMPPRRKKPYGWTRSADRSVPHPDFPAVSSVPVDWRPGGKGRPPVGSYQSEDGKWHLPKGFKLIDGQVYPPMALFRDAASRRKHQRDADRQSRKRRTRRSASEARVSEQAASEPEANLQPTPKVPDATIPQAPEEQPPQSSERESPREAPPPAAAGVAENPQSNNRDA
ncbi:MAG: hypothetical protein HS108_04930 [Planctomycetes bacterium]|nr:hypothetical protein [Planctomycetota bacterium]